MQTAWAYMGRNISLSIHYQFMTGHLKFQRVFHGSILSVHYYVISNPTQYKASRKFIKPGFGRACNILIKIEFFFSIPIKNGDLIRDVAKESSGREVRQIVHFTRAQDKRRTPSKSFSSLPNPMLWVLIRIVSLRGF